jgi:hypothetical protein
MSLRGPEGEDISCLPAAVCVRRGVGSCRDLALFHLGCILMSSDDIDRFLELAPEHVVGSLSRGTPGYFFISDFQFRTTDIGCAEPLL